MERQPRCNMDTMCCCMRQDGAGQCRGQAAAAAATTANVGDIRCRGIADFSSVWLTYTINADFSCHQSNHNHP